MNIYDIYGNETTILNSDYLRIMENNLASAMGERIKALEETDQRRELPVLRLYGDISGMTKDDAVNLDAEFTDGVRSFKCIAKTKWQGQSSLQYPKKNFNIKFIDKSKNKLNLSFKDWYLTNGFHLKANYYDYSMSRNNVGVALGRKCFPEMYPNNAMGVVDGFPCILYINDVWHGCYTWNLSQTEDLFAMDTTNPDHVCFRPADISWDIENFEIRCPETQTALHTELLTRMVNWTKTCTDADFRSNAKKYFNVNSLINYWLFVEIACAGDSMVNNSTWATWDGKIWYVLWYDADIIFGQNSELYDPSTDLIEMSKTTYTKKYNPIWEKLLTNFYSELCSRYAELRESLFPDAATIIKYFTDYTEMWGSDNLQQEYQKWSGRPLQSDRIQNKTSWITSRLAYCDNKYGYTS